MLFNLETLILYECYKIRNCFTEEHTNLKTLILNFCPSITDIPILTNVKTLKFYLSSSDRLFNEMFLEL